MFKSLNAQPRDKIQLMKKTMLISEHICRTSDGIHWHNYYELEFVTKGRAVHYINGNRVEIEPGSAYLLSYTDFHEVQPIDELRLYCVQFEKSDIDSLILDRFHSGAVICRFDEAEAEHMKSEFERLKSEYYSDNIFHREMARFTFNHILLEFFNQCNNSPMPLKHSLPDKFLAAVRFIHLNFSDDIPITEVAEACKLSPNYLSSVFRTNTGLSFSEYVTALRLRHAAEMLKTTTSGISDIGKQCGFSSPSYFIKTFKKQYGTTPSEYRQAKNTIVFK